MLVVSVLSQKGGVAKSTLCRAIAAQASSDNLKVKLADLDTQQATTTEWHKDRLYNGFGSVGSVEIFDKAENVQKNVSGFDLVVIDGTPRASKGTLELAKISDLVILPTCSSKDDLRPSIRLAYELENNNIPKGKILFALTRVSNESEIEAAREYIYQSGYSVLKGCLYERPLYRKTQDKGLAITEVNHKSLKEKATILIDDVANYLTHGD